MEKAILIGAGGLAREIESWNTQQSGNVEFIGCLDDNLLALADLSLDLKVLDQIQNASKYDNFVMAVMDCDFKENFHKKHEEKKIQNYIHSTSMIGMRTIVGKGLVLMPYAIISCDAIISDLVFVNSGSQIGHDVKIGNYTSIMANVDIGGGAVIGSNVFIGSGATILPGVKIPDGTRIGAGSVVLRSIKTAGSYFGNPAKKIF